MNQATVFSDDPAATARHWVDQGARRLHLVDLNGAFAGKPKKRSGNPRDHRRSRRGYPGATRWRYPRSEHDRTILDDGLSYVIIGTAAVKNPGFLQDACTAFGGHIIVGLDAKDGKVATDGWSKLTGHEVADLARKFEDYGCEAIVYTDIGRDGMLQGINIEATVRLAQAVKIPVIASGGLSQLNDIDALCGVEEYGIEGGHLRSCHLLRRSRFLRGADSCRRASCAKGVIAGTKHRTLTCRERDAAAVNEFAASIKTTRHQR